jgi:GntP family gluconate:H+ symporter
MDILAAFAITLLVISLMGLWFRAYPFLGLLSGAILFGLLVDLPLGDTLYAIIRGMFNILSMFGIIVFAGLMIAEFLRASGGLDRILSRLRGLLKNPYWSSTLGGYLLSVPLMCSFTTFVVLSPVIAKLEEGAGRRSLLYAMATGSVISYLLIYPSPVILVFAETGLFPGSPLLLNLVTIPLSLGLLVILFLLHRLQFGKEEGAGSRVSRSEGEIRFGDWAPFIIPVLCFAIGLAILPLHFLATFRVAFPAGMAAAVVFSPRRTRMPAFLKGLRRAAIILLDIGGAGALGGVFLASGLPAQAFQVVARWLPVILVPFFLAMLLQAALGTRISAVLVTAEIMTQGPLAAQFNPFSLVILITAGIFLISYLTDPLFWLIERVTGDPMATVLRYYTLPLLIAGLVVLACGLGIQIIS